MRRIGIVAVLGLSLVTLVAPGVSARRGGPGDGGRGRGGAALPLRAWAGSADQGGTLRIAASVRGRRHTCATTLTVSAVLQFATGDVSTDLAPRRHRSRTFQGSVPVAMDETPGPVNVDVTATCGDLSATVTVVGEVTGVTQPPEQPTN